jgi:esterase/lipase
MADLKLGSGMNSTYFSDAEDYAFDYQHLPNVYVCGHSLGGAIAQVVGNRRQLKFVTFNAPGVAVVASRNIADASLTMSAVRTVGMVASVFRHPMQAMRDMRAAFNEAHGLNVCLQNDVVSKIGVHYGEVLRIQGSSSNPLTEHKMDTVLGVLRGGPYARWDASWF